MSYGDWAAEPGFDRLTHGRLLGVQGDLCSACGGSGVDSKRVQRHSDRHRYTTGGRDEEVPCSVCGGSGEVG